MEAPHEVTHHTVMISDEPVACYKFPYTGQEHALFGRVTDP